MRKGYPFPKQALVFTCQPCKAFENSVGKGEIAHKEQLLLYHSSFDPFRELSIIISKFHNCHLQTLSLSKSLKFVVWERSIVLVDFNPLPEDKF